MEYAMYFHHMDTFRQIIDVWPSDLERTSRQVFAADCGVPKGTAQQWHLRDSIPPARWLTVIRAAKGRGVPGITLELLAKIAAKSVAGSVGAA